jgi:hypothetical protein
VTEREGSRECRCGVRADLLGLCSWYSGEQKAYIGNVYEELDQIAQLKFAREMEAIASQTRRNVEDAAKRFAATAGAAIRSGHHEASLGQLRIDGVEQMARALYQIWVDMIQQRNGHIARAGATSGGPNS